jgi:hypothetical protein
MSERLNIHFEAGKGDDVRPRQVTRKHYESEFDRIFARAPLWKKQKEEQDQ